MVQVAIITGGASGIGYGVVQRLVQLGWNVAIIDFNADTGRKAEQIFGKQVIYIKANVADYEEQATAFATIFEKWGRIDLVFANAGIGDRLDFAAPAGERENGTPAKPDMLVLDIDLYGVVYSSYLALHFFRKNASKSGKLIMTSSMAGLYPSSVVLYGAAKSGVIGLTRAIALRMKSQKEDITVNCICPNFVATPIVSQIMIDALPKERLTPIATIVRAVENFVNDSTLQGQAAECSGTNIHYRPPYEPMDENTDWLSKGRFATELNIDRFELVQDSIRKGKKIEALLNQ